MEYTIIPPPDAARENRISPLFRFDTSFERLYEWMKKERCQVEKKEDGGFIIAGSFVTEDYIPVKRRGQTYVGRYAENIKEMTMLPIDVDGGMTLDEARERWKEYQYILYSSFNHLKDGKTHKFRVLIEYEKPIDNASYSKRRRNILKWLGGDNLVDGTCLYRSRGFYLPTIGKHNAKNVVLEFHPGKKIDPYQFECEQEKPYTPHKLAMSDSDKQEVIEKLRETVIDSYHTWWQMVQAMKSEGYSEQDVMWVSANNPLHTSPTTGIKTQSLCRDTYRYVKVQTSGMGKLITMIRKTHPDFRKSRVSTLELKVKEKKRLLDLINKK